jgi:DNA-binding IclR family transcriptional regulator
MSSAGKTLDLLSHFSVTRPEIGLSQLCRLAGRDKATTHRHLQALEEAGFVEKNPLTKSYRLGPVVLQLAHTREMTVPRKASAEPVLAQLADVTGETTHISVLSGGTVYPLFSCESRQHSTRIIIDTQKLPLHATSSGLCALAFGPAELFDTAAANLTAFTSHTIQTREELALATQKVRESGFSKGIRSFQSDVASIAVPVFDHTGLFAGAVSVASVATRFTPELERCIRENLVIASHEITRNWGGRIPADLEALWAKSFTSQQDTAS